MRVGTVPGMLGACIGQIHLQQPPGKLARYVGWIMDWIELAQGREIWRALVSAVMNLRVP